MKNHEMDEENDQGAYIIETVDQNLHSENDSANKIVLNNTPVVICSEDGIPSHYMPCLENGQIILRKIEGSNISRLTESPHKTDNCIEDELSEEITVNDQAVHDEIKEPVILNSLISIPKKRLSYETTFTPSLPAKQINKGSGKGFLRYGRKYLIIDQQIMIPPREFKQQLINTDDLITNLELAPCSKQQMQRMLSGFTRMFAYPAHKMPNSKLLQLYASNCISRKQENIVDIADVDEFTDNCVVSPDFNTVKQFSRKRKCSQSENEACESELKNDSAIEDNSVLDYNNCIENNSVLNESCNSNYNLRVETACIEFDPANSANLDHKYSKQIDSSVQLTDKSKNNDSAMVEQQQELEIIDDRNLGIKVEDLSEEHFMIIDDTGADITQNNLEILLAAASESTELNQIVTICDENGMRFSKNILIVRDDKVEQILGS